MNKYEMPLIVVGNNYNNEERKITYDEAKNFLDKYGIKYHEIESGENNNINFENIFNDLGEQVLYQEIIEKDNNINLNENKIETENINENSENINKLDKLEKNKEINKKEENEKEKEIKNNKVKKASLINKPFKPKIKTESNDVKEKKTTAQIKREELVREKRLKREKEMQQWYKKKRI